MIDEPARLTEVELVARLRTCRWPGPVVHVGPGYLIANFADFDNPYPGYFHGARVVVDAGLMDQVAVEEFPLTV